MNNHFVLRRATNDDFDALFHIYMDVNVNRFLNFEIMDKDTFHPIFSELMNSGELYVYSDDKQVMATCIVMRQKRRAQHVVSLGTLAVHPDFQRKDIGKQFMEKLFKLLKDRGISRIDLCVEADNPVAQTFYKKLGFQLEGVLKQYFKRPYENHYVDEHMMVLFI